MKIKYRISYILMFLPLFVTAIALPFFPDKIPAHYNAAGDITRWGSKYEKLIFPILTVVFGFALIALAKYYVKKKSEYSNEKVLVYTNMGTLLLFNILTYIFLYKAYFISTSQSEPINVDIIQITFIGLGILMCILGNIKPKCKLNSVVGLRTKWSMANDTVWFKSQRFGGISFIIGGVLMIIAGLFSKGIYCIIFSSTILFIDTIVCVVASYIIYKKHNAQKELPKA